MEKHESSEEISFFDIILDEVMPPGQEGQWDSVFDSDKIENRANGRLSKMFGVDIKIPYEELCKMKFTKAQLEKAASEGKKLIKSEEKGDWILK